MTFTNLQEPAPANRQEQEATAVANGARLNLTGHNLLLAEDEYFLADDLKAVFEGHGANIVGPAATLEQAHALVGSETAITGAILDIGLRGESIFPVVDALMERGVPLVFVTGYSRDAIPSRYHHIPRWEKPFNADQLAHAIPVIIDMADIP
jgi:DNA-binding response OmpR family regulator